jgi:hypothetical protein
MIAMRKVRLVRVAVLFFATGGATLQAAQQAQQPPSPPATQPAPAASKTAVVWVNTTTGFYHQPGSRYYGKTKHGKYMSEADAIRAGYRAAQN